MGGNVFRLGYAIIIYICSIFWRSVAYGVADEESCGGDVYVVGEVCGGDPCQSVGRVLLCPIVT